MSRKFKASEICPSPPHGVWTWNADDVRGYGLYSGHFSYDFIDEMDPAGTKLIMLRDPLKRVVSTYDFWRSYRFEYIRDSLPAVNGPAVAKAGTLRDFLDADSSFVKTYIYNTAARQLLGHRFEALWPDTHALIRESRQVLRRFDWVGVTEAFEPSVGTLSSLLGLPQPRWLPHEGETYDSSADSSREPVQPTQPTDEERARITTENQIDIALHQEACDIVQEQTGYRFRNTTLI